MKKKLVVAVIAKVDDAHRNEKKLALLRDLGLSLKKNDIITVTHFSSVLTYVKEAVLLGGGTMLSFSPACSKSEHETIFRYGVVDGESIVYTGLGKHLTVLTLVRSSDVIICIDSEARKDVESLRDETVYGKIFDLGEEAVNYIHDQTISV